MPATIEGNPHEAKRLFLAITGGTGVIDKAYGPHRRAQRAIVLSALYGRRVPQSKAPWCEFRAAMLALFAVAGNCDAARDSALRDAALAFNA